MTPKAFISYSWTSERHQEAVRSWADRLLADGVNVVLDQYDLKEGDDKYAFMEKMVTDASVSGVMMIPGLMVLIRALRFPQRTASAITRNEFPRYEI